MKPKNAKNELEKFIKKFGTPMGDLTPAQGVQLMLDFYRAVRADGCDMESDGDMLLFQWGTYDFDAGRSFQFDLTRQFILEGSEDDDGITQLSFTFHFTPSAEMDALRNGNQWCSTPANWEDFASFITGGEAFRIVGSLRAATVTLYYSGV